MSEFTTKVLGGSVSTEGEWNDHLIEAHRKSPSQTPRAFADYKTMDGESSYDRLANVINKIHPVPRTIVDLGCGDGHLIPFLLRNMGDDGSVTGIDMSTGEFEIARRNHSSPRVDLRLEAAQKTSLKDSSVDLIVCHMAFMLMLPVEPVVSEIARVLRPGGFFVAVIGNGGVAHGLYLSLLNQIQTFLKEEFPAMITPKTGDLRVRTVEGLRELFNPQTGFAENLTTDDFDLIVNTTPDNTWNIFRDMYLIGMLPEQPRERLRTRIKTLAANTQDSSGRVSFSFPMRQIMVRKR